MKRYRAIVVGSGAGGAPAAARLAAAWGEGVAIYEAGPHLRAADFNQVERDLLPRLYAQGGAQATEDGALSIVQGALVGGSTVVNDGLCFRPPPELEARWRACGADLNLEQLRPFVDQVEAAMEVETIPREKIGKAGYLVGLGAARLGWRGMRMRHNSPGCVQCGFRHLGCAYDAKRSMNLTFVPLATDRGAALVRATVERVERVGGAWRVHAGEHTADADVVVLAAGVVMTPTILLRSGIAAGEGLQHHVQSCAWGDFEEPVDGHAGITMTYGVLEFADVEGMSGPGYLIESCTVQPMAFAVRVQAQGAAHDEVLGRYRHLAGAVSLIRSKARGRVRLGEGGRPAIDYPLVPEDLSRLQHFDERATELFLAAGARRVLLGHRAAGWLTAPPGPLPRGPGWQSLYTAHPFGGACRGSTPDGVGRAAPGLWVLDGSAFPEALGVNPQVTIAALALEGAERILAG